jgi:hypothetical protein
MIGGKARQLGLGVPDVREGEVGEEDGGVVGGEEESGEGPFVVVGYSVLEEGEGVREGAGDLGFCYFRC